MSIRVKSPTRALEVQSENLDHPSARLKRLENADFGARRSGARRARIKRSSSKHKPSAGPVPDDHSLASIANPMKKRNSKFEAEASSELSSDTQRFRRKKQDLLDEPDYSSFSSSSSSSLVERMPRHRGKKHGSRHRRELKLLEDDSSSDLSDDSDIDLSDSSEDLDMPPPEFGNHRLETEMERAIEKAKLLARIDQLTGRGVKASKPYTYRASIEELRTEVIRMEVLATRSVRIQQGRAVFISGVGGMEKLMNTCDENEWLPFDWYMKGFTRVTAKDITNYDDALERGVESMLGDGDSMPWYAQLALILVPAMVTHSMMKRFESPEHTNEVLKNNPELRQSVARELASEMRQTEAANVAQQRQFEQRQQNIERQTKSMADQQAATASAASRQTRLKMSAPRPPAPTTPSLRPTLEVPAPDMTNADQMNLDIERNTAIARQKSQIQQQEVRLNNLEQQLAEAQKRASEAEKRAKAAAGPLDATSTSRRQALQNHQREMENERKALERRLAAASVPSTQRTQASIVSDDQRGELSSTSSSSMDMVVE